MKKLIMNGIENIGRKGILVMKDILSLRSVLLLFLLSMLIVSLMLVNMGSVFAGYEAQYGEKLHPSDNAEVGNPATVVYIDVVDAENGDVKAYVKMTTPGRPLFGAAFNFIYDNSLLDYQGYQVGGLFAGDDVAGFDPMVLVTHDRDKLITGLSLKRGDELINSEGELIIFNFKRRAQGDIDFEFHEGVLASLVDDQRRNFLDVDWENYYGVGLGQVNVFEPIDNQWQLPKEIGYFVAVFVASLVGAFSFVVIYNFYLGRKIKT
ncbi:hypothetical protein KKG71_00880 [Patescibacteria group bacterium]|nr:hypothetical protein [Patescibacteria group bacterium]